MNMKRATVDVFIFGFFLSFGVFATAHTTAPLPSWNDSTTKQFIIDFVTVVTKEGSPDFIAPAERIAVFDNDGTLRAEHPIYVQSLFALDRVKGLATQHPEM